MSTEQPPKKKTRPPFKPTREQHEFVNRMAGTRMTVTDIALVIGVSRRTLYKYFRSALEAGSAMLHALVTNKFVEAIKNGSPWAIQRALRNLEKFRYDRYDKGVPYIANPDPIDEIKITFVQPSRKEEPPPIDVTPPAYQNAQPDYSKPVLEPPRERTRTEFGAIHEAPRHEKPHREEYPSYESQTGEPRPSVFDRPGKNLWMK
jgi:hypothetical protein